MKRILVGILATSFALAGCQKQPKADFATPEGAILMLEEAYRKKDVEAAVAAKDFVAESRVMLSRLKGGLDKDAEVLKKSAEVMELAFRAEMKKKGFPDFEGVRSHFPKKERYQSFEDIVLVTEVCVLPGGRSSTQKLLVVETAKGWRVLNVVE